MAILSLLFIQVEDDRVKLKGLVIDIAGFGQEQSYRPTMALLLEYKP